MVVRGSAREAASRTSRSGTPASERMSEMMPGPVRVQAHPALLAPLHHEMWRSDDGALIIRSGGAGSRVRLFSGLGKRTVAGMGYIGLCNGDPVVEYLRATFGANI